MQALTFFDPNRIVAKWRWLSSHPGYRRRPLVVLARLAIWRARCSLRLPATVTLEPWKVWLSLPPQWRGMAKLIFAFREDYEPELHLLGRLLKPGAVFVDVGAGFGIYTLVGSKLVGPQGTVLAFEPTASTFEVLEANVERNQASNILTFRLALADFSGQGFVQHEADPGRNALQVRGPASGAEAVAVDRLDDVLARLNLARLDLIKLDVEGSEELVLAGSERAVAAYRPAVIFEVNPEASARLGLQSDGAWRLLSGLGYRFWQMGRDGQLEELNGCPGGGNVLALPR